MSELTAELVAYVDDVKNDAVHAYKFLEETGTLAASRIFGVTHRAQEHDALISVRFPGPWARNREPKVSITKFSDNTESVLNEERLNADTLIHVHTPYLAAWSLAQKPFPILYVAAQRHILAREIPNHLERTRSILDVVRERLDTRPDLAPPPALLESNGGVNIWGRGVLKTAELILLIEESARLQAIAEQIGGAKVYTPGALDLQWKRTGLLEKARAYSGDYADA